MTFAQKTDRLGCLNPQCRRTFKRDGDEPYEVCCSKCWKLLPVSLTRRYRALKQRDRRIGRLFRRERKAGGDPNSTVMSGRMSIVAVQIIHAKQVNWQRIHDFFHPVETPAGLAAFLEEMNL